ncbi:hypothetical protein Q5752_004842 [Cryptotrichosporon argae]
MSSLAARSPRSRKSLSLSEANLNRMDLATPNATPAKDRKKRGVSMGGVSMGGEALRSVDFGAPAPAEVAKGAVVAEAVVVAVEAPVMSPRRQARRSMKPRKSILKLNTGEDATTDFSNVTQQYAHTIAFGATNDGGRPGLARRVSFAPNAHVRMFDSKPPASKPRHSVGCFTSAIKAGASRPSHSRRSSITNIAALRVTAPSAAPAPTSPRATVRVEDVGEQSMDIDSDSSLDEDNVSYVSNASRVSAQSGAFDDNDDEYEDDEDEMDMEETGVYGGVLGANSDVSGATDETGDDDSRVETALDDEEKTMDFTIAVGGVMPHSPPVGAQAGRASIGYSMHGAADGAALLPGHGADALGDGEVEMEMEMDETVAYGGIINDSLSSADDTVGSVPGRERTMTFNFTRDADANADAEADAMDMTIAHGGVISSATATHGFPASPHPSSGRVSDAGHTPSFARATASSVRKSTGKRNVFAPSPSPSPTKTPTAAAATPVRGMAAAGDVAKRLSFGSTTSSGGGRKRVHNDAADVDVNGEPDVALSATKRPRVVADEVFAPTPPPAVIATGPLATLPRLSLGTPRRSLGTPMRLKSPAKPAVAIVPEPEELAFEPEHPADDADEWDEADVPPTITLPAFLEMAGVQFMETLPLLNRRCSSVGRGVLGQTFGSGDREFALHEYTEAQVHNVFLNMYNWASDKMKNDLRLGADELADTEARCSAENPPVVREYLAAPDEDRPLFEMTFKTFKTNTMLQARERWYDWKMSLMERISPDVRELREGMELDRDRVAAEMDEVDTLLPKFQERMVALKAELERERAAVREITACDQAELADYKAAIAEQNTAIDMFRNEVDEATAKADDLQAKLDELEAVKREHVAAIASAKSKCDQFTKSDVARLQQEYASLQELHLWRPTRITPALFEAEFDHEIRLAVPCRVHVPDCAAARVELVGKRAGATEPLFGVIAAAVAGMRAKDLGSLVRQTGQLWSAAQRMRQELRVLAFRHPVTFASSASSGADAAPPAPPALVATAAIVLGARQSKVLVDFVVGAPELARWPDGVADVAVRARTVYGSADADAFAAVVQDTVRSAVAYVPGVLVQGCVDAAAACA